MTLATRLEFSGLLYSPEVVEDDTGTQISSGSGNEPTMENRVLLLQAALVKQAGKGLFGIGGGIASNSFTYGEYSDSVSVGIVSVTAGVLMGPGNLKISYASILGSENVGGIASLGYQFVF